MRSLGQPEAIFMEIFDLQVSCSLTAEADRIGRDALAPQRTRSGRNFWR